ncbi:MAG: hypothetical protein SGJ20_07740 [Planctomycetota bacterium]|nr:hypothetical protein [Planctomycetota bacterium]
MRWLIGISVVVLLGYTLSWALFAPFKVIEADGVRFSFYEESDFDVWSSVYVKVANGFFSSRHILVGGYNVNDNFDKNSYRVLQLPGTQVFRFTVHSGHTVVIVDLDNDRVYDHESAVQFEYKGKNYTELHWIDLELN